MTDTARSRGHRAAAGEGDRLREELLDAAEAELLAKGSAAGLSLRAVARAVGVSPTAVYLHFDDKDALVLAVCSRRFDAFAAMLREARVGHDSPAAQLRACGRAYVRFGLEHPEQYEVLFGGSGMSAEQIAERLGPEEMVGLQALHELAEVVRAGVDAAEFRPVDPFPTAVSLWAVTHGLVGVLTHGHGDDAEEVPADVLVDHTLDLLLTGLQA